MDTGMFPWRRRVVWTLLLVCGSASLARGERVPFYVSPGAGAPVRNAVRIWQRALESRGHSLRPSEDPRAARVLISREPGKAAESFEIRKNRGTVTLAASDDVGLTYAVFELLGQVESAPASVSMMDAISATARAPDTAI